MNCTNCGSGIVEGSIFCDKCGQPVSSTAAPAAAQPVQQPVQQQPAFAQPAPAQPKSSSSSCMMWGLGCGCLVLILVGLIAVGGGAYKFRDKIKEMLGKPSSTPTETTVPDGAAPTNVTSNTPSSTTPAAAGTVKVTLGWSQPVDMDLEIWDAEGENLKVRSFNKCGEDVTSGVSGTKEFFEFKNFGDGDNYSRGNYVVSVYFAKRDDESITSATAKLTVTKADGSTVTKEKTIYWEPGKDQWHAFRINAATGDIRNMDRFIRIRTRDSN